MPSLAIAEQLTDVAGESNTNIETHFICSDKEIDTSILSRAEVSFTPVTARPFIIKPFPTGLIRFITGFYSAYSTSRKLFQKLQLQNYLDITVVTMGGYVSSPVARAACKLGIEVLLVNLDVIPGKANRLTARWATRIVYAVECRELLRSKRAVISPEIVGMPVRKAALASDSRGNCRIRLGLEPDIPVLLIIGASQGSTSFNDLLTTMSETEWSRKTLKMWQILHICGSNHGTRLKEHYEKNDIKAVVLDFCSDMNDVWGSAELALSRAGASSVAEAIANGVPTVFVPYPWHKDEHQMYNAKPWVDQDCAWLAKDYVDTKQNLAAIGKQLVELMQVNSDDRIRKQNNLNNLSKKPASEIIARQILSK